MCGYNRAMKEKKQPYFNKDFSTFILGILATKYLTFLKVINVLSDYSKR